MEFDCKIQGNQCDLILQQYDLTVVACSFIGPENSTILNVPHNSSLLTLRQ